MSSILVKGMSVPSSCGECSSNGLRSAIWNFGCACSGDFFDFSNPPPADCPISAITPNSRCIEAEPIIQYITDGLNRGEFGYDTIKVLTEIQYAPTVIPAE